MQQLPTNAVSPLLKETINQKNAKKSPLLHSPSTFPTFQPFQAAFNDIPSKASTPKASPSGGWTWKPQHESYLSFRGCCYALISVYNIIQLYIICGCRMTRWYHMVIIFSMYVYIYVYVYIYNMCVCDILLISLYENMTEYTNTNQLPIWCIIPTRGW